jgi:hypothetical protein
MSRSLIVLIGLASLGRAGELSIHIGNPVAAQSALAKRASLVFRTTGCEDLSKLQVSGKAEGLVTGQRRTLPLAKIAPMPTAGVYAVYPEWTAEGAWLVSLTAHCGGASAYALVPVGPKGFSRETSKFLKRPATESEIETMLSH